MGLFHEIVKQFEPRNLKSSPILPIVASFLAPELAPFLGITGALGTAALGAGLSGGGDLLLGGKPVNALEDAVGGGLGAGGSDYLAGQAGLSGAGASALSKGLTGAAIGASNGGGLSGALTGGVTGGVGGYFSGGGSLSSLLGGSGSGAANLTDPGIGGVGTDGALTGGTGASGILTGGGDNGSLTAGSNALTNGGSITLGGGGSSSFAPSAASGSSFAGASGSGLSGNALSTLLSGGINAAATSSATDQLVKSQQNTLNELQPFLSNGTGASNTLATDLGTNGNTGAAGYGSLTAPFNPSNLQNTPGYQFSLSQGNNALTNSEAAAGNLDSGAALKAAQQFGQGLASTTYNTAFNQDLATKQNTEQALAGQANSGLIAGNIVGDVNNNIGNAGAKGTTSQANNITTTLANLLSGSGTKRVIGQNPDGTLIYGS